MIFNGDLLKNFCDSFMKIFWWFVKGFLGHFNESYVSD